jgi:glycosyltransferase involved in cell wall biosynthesis
MKVVAVMPAFQEEPRIGAAVLGVKKHVATVVVVDDGSTDRTAERAHEAGAVVLKHALNRGQGAALKTGTLAALELGAEIIVHVDADGQHDPEFLPALIRPLEENVADVVFGSRFLGVKAEGMPFTRRFLLMGGRLFSSYVLGIPRRMTDPQSGLRAFRASVAAQLDFTQDRFAHASEILRLVTRSSWRWTEVPVRIRYTEQSLAKGQKALDAFKIVWQLFIGAFRK